MEEAVELTPEQSWELFDREARRTMGLSGEEFLVRLDRGDYDNPPEENIAVERMAMLLPFARAGQ